MLDPQIAFIGFTSDSAQIAVCLDSSAPQVVGIYADVLSHVPLDWKKYVQPLDSWPELLIQEPSTLIIVSLSSTTPQNQDMLRKLVAAGCSVALIRPDSDCLFAYELEMIRVESEGRLHPIHFRRPELETLSSNTNQISVLAPVDPSDLEEVILHLTRDLLQLHDFIGHAKYIFALAPGDTDTRSGLSITIETEQSVVIQWSCGDASQPDSIFSNTAGSKQFASSTFDPEEIIGLLSFDDSHNKDASNGKWIEFATAREAAEMIPLSLKRGRKIELFNVPPTESDAFKGVMSGAGCFLLLATLAVIGLFAGFDIARLSDLRDAHQTMLANDPSAVTSTMPLFLRLWPVYPLVLFLAFQFLRRIIKTSDPHKT